MRPAAEYVIVITGDLVEDANVSGVYDQARARIDRLRQAGFAVLVIPGNHDYGTGDLGSKEFVERFKQAFFGDASVTYPKLDVIGDIAFIGLDSMAEELHWYNRLFANGQLGEAQMERLDACLSDPAVEACSHRVVCLHHHPFDPKLLHELKDSAALGEVLAGHGNVDALLYGHNHEGWKRPGQWGIGRCYDAGSATRKDGKPGYHRVIDLGGDPRLDYDGDFFCNRDLEEE
jgi:3',5'-cyclic AMP phosphodiesterase CpdA